MSGTGARIGLTIGGLVVALGVAAWALAPRDPVLRAESAAGRGDWGEVISQTDASLKRRPDDPKALALRARAFARLGRSAETRAAYRTLGAERMTPPDLVALARLLAADHRPALALLAMEAASRLAPKDADVLAAMTDLRRSIGSRGEVAHVADHLGAVPSGPALAALVVGASALCEGDSADDPLLDRLMARDRKTLRAIDSPQAARRLIARALLENGRATEARAELQGLPGPEAQWLRSRALIQAGDLDGASAALDRAGDFARDREHQAEPALYVGAKECRRCHAAIHDSEQSSRHATTLHHGADLARIPLPEGSVADPVDAKVVHTFRREGDKIHLETRTPTSTYRALMDYALGSGHRGMTLIGRDEGGTYREARISHYSETGSTWDVTTGFSPHPGDPAEYLGKALSPAGFRDCIHCHTTRFRSIEDRSGPEASDRGIGCERCHGPGGNHVRAMDGNFGDPAIGRYKGMSATARMSACSGCHASDGTFPPTDPQFIRFQSTTLPFSKCFTESNGQLDCVTCHDPHKTLETSPAYYVSKCLSCHGPEAKGSPSGFRRVECPVNAKSECLKCHMPTVPEVVPHTSFTDHHIRVHREETGR